MRKIFIVILFLVMPFLLPSFLQLSHGANLETEAVKIFRETTHHYQYKGNLSPMNLEEDVNDWLTKHKSVVITQRCMSTAQDVNKTIIVISIFYKKE